VRRSTVLLATTVIAVVIIAGVSAVYFWWPSYTIVQPTERKSTIEITLYAGETPSNFSFGLTTHNLTSPGPTLRFKVGDVVQVKLVNVGKFSHSFAITDAPKGGAPVLFNATIGSAKNPIPPGGSGAVTFVVDKAGDYYYMCQVHGHVDLGMWGRVIVEP
jgi:uncharacterized cupredoxin-like copper-binding protein